MSSRRQSFRKSISNIFKGAEDTHNWGPLLIVGVVYIKLCILVDLNFRRLDQIVVGSQLLSRIWVKM